MSAIRLAVCSHSKRPRASARAASSRSVKGSGLTPAIPARRRMRSSSDRGPDRFFRRMPDPRAFGRFFQNHHRPHMFRPFQYEPNTKRGAIMEAMKLLLTAVCSVTVCGSVFAAPPPPPHYYRNDGVALAAGIVGVVRSAIAPVVYTVAPPPPPPVYYAYPPPPPPPYPFYGYPPPPPAWGPGPRVYNVPPPPPPPRHHRGRW